MWNLLVTPFGYIIRFCYGFLNDYGLALFFYALITKAILLPLSIKQQKSQLSMIRLRPYQEELMKKYGGNKQRYQQELMNLYQREGYSPMSSCLPTLIQLPVIMLIYTIVRRPLTYLAGWNLSKIWENIEPLKEAGVKLFDGANLNNFHRYELQLFSHLSENGGVYNEAGEKISAKFLGIFDLTKTPNQFKEDGMWWLILIPVIAALTSYLVSWVSQKLNAQTADPSQGSMKMMTIIMPLVSLFISYGFTAALGFFWIAQNIVSIGQVLLLNKIYSPKKAIQEVEDKIRREKEAEKEKRRLAAEKRALAGSKNSKKKRAMNAQHAKAELKPASDVDTDNTQETKENGN